MKLKLLKLLVILKDRFFLVKMERNLSALIAMMLLSVYFELTGAPNSDLQLCTSCPQPCIYQQAQPQEVCHGQNASTTMELKLPLDMIQQITVIGIAIRRGTERLIQGLSKNPSYPYLERWAVSHTIRGAGSKSGVLTVKVEVLDAHLNDEFKSYVELNAGAQIMRTPDEIWFLVKANCSSYSILTDDEGKSTTHSLEPINHVLPAASNITSEEDKLEEITIRLHTLESTAAHGLFVLNLIIGMFCAFLVCFLVGCIFSKIPRKYCSYPRDHFQSTCHGISSPSAEFEIKHKKRYIAPSNDIHNVDMEYLSHQTFPADPNDHVNSPHNTSPNSSHYPTYGCANGQTVSAGSGSDKDDDYYDYV